MLRRSSLLTVPIILLACACGPDTTPSARNAKPVTEAQAIQVLTEVSARSHLNPKDFCQELAYQVESCNEVRKQAAAFCLKPGPAPRVLRSAAVPATKNSDGGRVLEIEGHTADGQKYVSEFFVTAPEGKPIASIGVYWSGAGLAESPLGEKRNLLPKSACTGT